MSEDYTPRNCLFRKTAGQSKEWKMSPQLMNAFTRGSLYTKNGSEDVVVVELRLLLGGMNLRSKYRSIFLPVACDCNSCSKAQKLS